MENTKRKSGLVEAIKAIASAIWNTAADCAFCCGIRLDREKRTNDMPTASSCCGVRL